MFPVYGVTHVPGCSSYDAESRPKLSGQLTNAAAQRPPRRASRAHGRAGRRRLEAR